MTILSSKDVPFLIIDGYDLRGFSTEISDPGAEHETKDQLFLGETLRHKALTGIDSVGTIEQVGAFDDAAGSTHEVLSDLKGSRVLSYGIGSNAIGSEFVGAAVEHVGYDPVLVQGDFNEARARYEVATGYERGHMLCTFAARTIDGDTQATALDNLAHSHLGGACYLQMTAITLDGWDSLLVKIRHSADGLAWADLRLFTVRTTLGAERLTIATDPIERYLAAAWAWQGAGGAGRTATFVVGMYRNQ